MELLTHSEVAALRRAIGEAELWRGTLTGNPDPVPLEEFDKFIAKAKTAMAKVQANNKEFCLENRA